MRVDQHPVYYLLPLLLTALLGGCRFGGSGMSIPTRSGEEVILTAQAFAEQTRQATVQTLPPTPVPPSPTPALNTPTPEPTPTSEIPLVRADYNAYVRAGPDETFENIDFFLEGQQAEVVGRVENYDYNPTSWYYIRRIGDGKDGWVWGGSVTLLGDANSIPLLDSPPTPEPDDDDD